MEKLLSLGSIVYLHGATKALMICGRIQQYKETGVWYEYSGCPFPEGFIAADQMNLFNFDDIDRIVQLGFQDNEEFEYRKKLIEIMDKSSEKNEG